MQEVQPIALVTLGAQVPKAKNSSVSHNAKKENDSEQAGFVSCQILKHLRTRLYKWDFNIFKFDEDTKGRPLLPMTAALLEDFELLDGWKISRQKLTMFMYQVESGYHRNPYHSNTHATDVTQTAAIILKSLKEQVKNLTKIELFAVILASAVHDLGHLGVNNDFLIKIRHKNAVVYNDKSVNENFHISQAFQLAAEREDCNVFDAFSTEEYKKVRQLMIALVLTTDMAVHFDLLDRYNKQLTAQPDLSLWEDRTLLLQMLVHLADLANPSRPFRIAYQWGERVTAEFFQQGDLEVNYGLPLSPFCNRKLVKLPKAQLNFIATFLKPTMELMRSACPSFITMALEQLKETEQQWTRLAEADTAT